MPRARPGCGPQDLDAVAYSFDPALAKPAEDMGLDDPWDHLRIDLRRAGTAVPGHRAARARPASRSGSCPHHVAHAASAGAGRPASAGSRSACWCSTGAASGPPTWPAATTAAALEVLAAQALPHSLGLLYESLTEHLGFLRSQRRVQGDGAGLLRQAAAPRRAARDDPRHRRRRASRRRSRDWTRWPRRARATRATGRRARRPRRSRAGAAGGGAASSSPAGCTSGPATGC